MKRIPPLAGVAFLLFASCSTPEDRRVDNLLSKNPHELQGEDILFLGDQWSELNESLIGCTESKRIGPQAIHFSLNAQGRRNLEKREKISMLLDSIALCPVHRTQTSQTTRQGRFIDEASRIPFEVYENEGIKCPLSPSPLGTRNIYCRECWAVLREISGIDESAKSRRQKHADKLSRIRVGDGKERVEGLLGRPEDLRRAPDPDFNLGSSDEVWCYGTNGHGTLGTLGSVCFRLGRVVWVAGGGGEPPSPSVIDEEELQSGMRFVHGGPEAPGHNDPLHLVRVTNYLRPLGKEKALLILGEYVRVLGGRLDETWIFLLLRTLFDVPEPPGFMPEVYIGRMSPAPPGDKKDMPRFPMVLIDDIPFSLLWGVTLFGAAQPVVEHLDCFRENGVLRAGKLRPPDDPYPSLQKLWKSKEWECLCKYVEKDWISNYSEHCLLQVLALARTAYAPPEARDPFAYPKMRDYDRYHREFLKTGARWDEKLQKYVCKDGTHGTVGRLVYRSKTD